MSTVKFIGAGPGDPELLTRKAWRVLSEAEIILHDALIDIKGMKAAAPNANWIYVGKRSGVISVEQEFISRMLVSYALKGYQVVRLKGGDPSIFGRLTEEIEACRFAEVDVEVIPGVTAASAAAAQIQASLTSRGVSRSVTFVTPRVGNRSMNNDSEWLTVSLAASTVVIYMASTQSRLIGKQLINGGKSGTTPVCIVESASMDGYSMRMTLEDLAETELPDVPGPVLIMMGETFSEASVQMHSVSKQRTNIQFDELAIGS